MHKSQHPSTTPGANCLYVTLALVPYLQMVRRFPPSPISLGKLGLLFGIMAAAEGGFLSLSDNEVLTVLPENMEKICKRFPRNFSKSDSKTEIEDVTLVQVQPIIKHLVFCGEN